MKAPFIPAQESAHSYSPNQVFICPEESQFYSQCLEKLLVNYCTPFDSIIEFGTGDGSPVIDCLLKTKFKGCIQGYELKPEACQLAETRIEQYQLKNRYVIHNQCFFTNCVLPANYLIANPPYLPAPDDQLYMPSLHGGQDGATLTKQLLGLGCDHALLMISSYSNPIETVQYAREKGYKIIDFSVSPLKFGYYSCEPKVQNTIAQLRQKRQAFYSPNIYFLAGVLFERNNTNPDLSEEFLKVMTVL